MKVHEMIAKLKEFDPEAEVIMAHDDMYFSDSLQAVVGGRDVDEVYESKQAIGLALPKPTISSIVVLDYSMRGL